MGLFGRDAPGIDAGFSTLRRIPLDETAWVEYVPGWVTGHQALMDQLVRTTRWQSVVGATLPAVGLSHIRSFSALGMRRSSAWEQVTN